MSAASPVVIAFDGSECAAAAVEQAGGLFGPRPACVLTVWEPLPPLISPTQLPSLDDELRRDAEHVAGKGAAAARAAGFEVLDEVVRQSRPDWQAAVDVAAEMDAAAIVVGARGRSALKSLLLGSFSTGAVHHAPCPVLVVHGGGEPAGQGSPALVCYDGSEDAKRAIAGAGKLLTGRPAVAVHVWEPLSSVASVPPVPGLHGALAEGLAEMDRIGADLSEQLAAEGAQLARDAGLDAQPLSDQRDGRAWRAIVALARERDAGVIVVGRRGASAVELAIMGSVSTAVVHHADRPVLVVP